MKKKNLLMFLPVIVLLSSCLTSLHQLVTYDNVMTDNRIIGTWKQNDNTLIKIENLPKSDFDKEGLLLLYGRWFNKIEWRYFCRHAACRRYTTRPATCKRYQ